MRFSIVVPFYNSKDYVLSCIEHLKQLAFDDFEAVFVDDGSSDGSEIIVKSAIVTSPFIKLFTKPNNGQLSAREFGVRNSCGDIILFLDIDDFLEPDSLTIIDKYFRDNVVDCLIFGFKHIDENGKLIKTYADKTNIFLNSKEAIFKVLSTQSYNSIWRKAFSREKIDFDYDFSSFYQLRHGEDLLQSLVYLNKCDSIVFVTNCFYNYVYSPSSISNKNLNEPKTSNLMVECFVFDNYIESHFFDDRHGQIVLSKMLLNLTDEVKRVCKSATPRKKKRVCLSELRASSFAVKTSRLKSKIGFKNSLVRFCFNLKLFNLLIAFVNVFSK